MCASHHLVNHTHRMNITTLAFYPAEVALFTLRGIIWNLTRIQPRPPCVHLDLGNPIVMLNHPRQVLTASFY